ncbi:MAG: antitoxin [Tetrasphaera sp.]|nr:antitoxin [Tetrasphaera sp.]
MKTLYLRNVPDDVSAALEELASAQSMSVSALAVRELTAAVAFRRNTDIVWSSPDLGLEVGDIVEVVRSGRDR